MVWKEKKIARLTLDEKSDGFGLSDVLDEGVLLLSEGVLVDESGVSEDVRSELVDRVLGDSSTAELEPEETKTKERRRGGQLLLPPFNFRTTSNETATTDLSMFLLLARRRAKIPCLTRTSRDMGSIPFWLMRTNVRGFSFELMS